jgi:hypothetical protein
MTKRNIVVKLLMRNGWKGTIIFGPRKVKNNIREETKNGRHVLGNTGKRLVLILMHLFPIL